MALAAPAAEPVAESLDTRQFGSHPRVCPGKTYTVVAGDYCWLIATNNGMNLEQFLNKNPGLDCNNLWVGVNVCL
jgi:LysM repeat protein